jgi:hypothetical protein
MPENTRGGQWRGIGGTDCHRELGLVNGPGVPLRATSSGAAHLRACFREGNYLNVRRINLGFKRILHNA